MTMQTQSIAPTPQPLASTGKEARISNATPVVATEDTSRLDETLNVVRSPAEEVSQGKQTPSRDQVDQAMQEMKKALTPVARNLQFSVDDETGRTVVKIVDSTTQEVIRQMPSEELLAITRALDKFSGLLLKQKA